MKYWTVDEARSFLPRLRELAEVIRRAAQVHTGVRGSDNGQQSPMIDAQEAFEELNSNDIILRDPLTGLADFRARGSDDVEYLLCWRLGEDDLGWWHLPEEGFPGRKPLPRDPE